MTVKTNEDKPANKRKTVSFVALSLLAVIVAAAIFVSWFNPSKSIVPSDGNWIETVGFTCRLNVNATFTVPVAVNLDDGMNSTEAVMVADRIFEHEMTSATYMVKSAEADADGVWTVKLSWGLVVNGEQESLSHFFDVGIDPLNQAVTYSRCF
jgi:acetyltransferase-like isoleucine patch superfamily enzyme